MKECKCKDWKENMPIIDDALILQSVHGFGKGLTKFCKYCPWCGKELERK